MKKQKVICTHCQTANGVTPDLLGKRIKCYGCQRSFVAVAEDSRWRDTRSRPIPCAHCGAVNKVRPEHLDQRIRCYSCQQAFMATPPSSKTAPQVVAAPPLPRGEPALRRWKASLRQTIEDHFIKGKTGIALLLVVLLLLVAGTYLGFDIRQERVHREFLVDSWRQADDDFRATRFRQAKDRYDQIVNYVSEHELDNVKDEKLAAAMSVVADACRQVAEFLATGLPPVEDANDASALEAADRQAKFVAQTEISVLANAHDLLQQWAEDFQEPESLPAPPAGESPSRFTYGTRPRWETVVSWLQGLVSGSINKWDETNPPPLTRVSQIEAFVDYTRQFKPLHQKHDTILGAVKREVAFRTELLRFHQLSQTALERPERKTIAEARAQWLRLEEIDGRRARNAQTAWHDYLDQLREALRSRMLPRPIDAANPLVGSTARTAPPALPLQAHTALAVPSPDNRLADADGLVFARIDDRCFALDAASGTPRWGCRVGVDVAWQPQLFWHRDRYFVALLWHSPTSEVLTLADDKLQPLWSWHLPAGQSFAGPPLVAGEKLHVLLKSGQFWQFEFTADSVEPRTVLELPEQIKGPPVSRDDGLGMLAIGSDLGAYGIDIENGVRIVDVLFFDSDEPAESVHGLWVPPAVILARNRGDETCQLLVYQEEEAGSRQTQSLTLPGRLWQPPAVSGSLTLVVTDQNAESVFVFNPAASPPLEPIFEERPPDSDDAVRQRPQFVAHRRGPFIAAVGPTLIRYKIDPTKLKFQRQREIAWTHSLPRTDSVPIQALQVSGGSVIVVSRGGESAVVIECLDVETGDVRWRQMFGIPVASVLGQVTADSLLLLDESGRFRRLQVADSGWKVQSLPDPPWQRAESENDASPLAVQTSDACTAPAQLVAYLDRDLRLSMQAANGNVYRCQGDVSWPRSGWLQPLWLSCATVLFAHPRGIIALATLEPATQPPALRVSAARRVAAGMVSGINAAGGQLSLTSGSECLVLERDSLVVIQRHPLPAPASTPPAGAGTLHVGLNDGTLLVIENPASDNAEVTRVPLSAAPLDSLSYCAATQTVFAIDAADHVFAVDADRHIVERWSFESAAAGAPFFVGKHAFLATAEGGLHELVSESREATSP